ncbi:MAG: hypothetical protein CSA15_12415 [Candidatus Delongbacteria bacterium]|nr:MAG: hypothetical protein CSA15_12415 [Candidatus Delongbacteria bacterium]
MLNIHISNSLEHLSDKFSESIKSRRDPFKKELIITQTTGMKRWLSINVVKNNSILANFDFLKPNQFFDKYLFSHFRNSYEYNYFNQNDLTWILYDILGSKIVLEDKKFSLITNYINSDEIKRFRISKIIADLFDQYSIYREDYISLWNRGYLHDSNNVNEVWQSLLYNMVKEKIALYSSEKESIDRVNLKEILLEKLKSRNSNLVEDVRSIERVSFFGIAILTGFHFKILEIVSKFIDVDFYIVSPFNNSFENFSIVSSFVDSYSTIIKDLFYILKSGKNSHFHNEFISDVRKNTLLDSIKYSISNNTEKIENIGLDDSIRVSSCYTPFREIEVLYDNLMDILEDRSVEPSDIIVMTPNINEYVSYIDVIFKSSDDENYIPYSIADRDLISEDSPINVVSKILNLSKGNYEAEELLSILESEFVKRRFGIVDMEIIRSIIKSASIKWGLDIDSTVKFGSYDNRFNSWEHGLKRIVLGYAISGEPLMEDGVYPIDSVEGNDSLEGLKIYGFIESIKWVDSFRSRKLSLKEWGSFLKEIFDRFIALDYSQIDMKEEFDSIINLYNSDTIKVSYKVMRESFTNSSYHSDKGLGFLSGGITFCSLLPMRSVPHKVVAIIGLNEHSFPGANDTIGFDLMIREKRVGDRDIKNSNKYLFFEALLSAKNYFYLSFQGKSPKTNKQKNGSKVIYDFIDFLGEKLSEDSENIWNSIVKEYPLHGYSRNYRISENNLHTYIKRYSAKTVNSVEREVELIENLIDESKEFSGKSTLFSFCSFFMSPVKYFYNNILGIYLNDEERMIEGCEKFEIDDSLSKWSIGSSILNGETVENIVSLGVKKYGNIPLGNLSEVSIRKVEEKYDSIVKSKLILTNNKEGEFLDVEYRGIEGRIYSIFGKEHSVFFPSSNFYKYLIFTFVEHLFLNIYGDYTTNFNSRDENLDKDSQIVLGPVDSLKSKSILDRLISIFKVGSLFPLNILPETGYNYYRKLRFPKRIKNGEIASSDQNPYGSAKKNWIKESEFNPYILNEYGDSFFDENSNLGNNFKYLSEMIFKDLVVMTIDK